MSSGGKVVECVPNFSEGRRKDVIDAISDAIRNTEGCSLLDVSPGDSTNRTVYTFVGTPVAVVNGALSAAHVAFKTIDMAKQKGLFLVYVFIRMRSDDDPFQVLIQDLVHWMCVLLYLLPTLRWKNVLSCHGNLDSA